jgi:hypothetical protein
LGLIVAAGVCVPLGLADAGPALLSTKTFGTLTKPASPWLSGPP